MEKNSGAKMPPNFDYCEADTCSNFVPCSVHHNDGDSRIYRMCDDCFFVLPYEKRDSLLINSFKSLIIQLRKMKQETSFEGSTREFFVHAFGAPQCCFEEKEEIVFGASLSKFCMLAISKNRRGSLTKLNEFVKGIEKRLGCQIQVRPMSCVHE